MLPWQANLKVEKKLNISGYNVQLPVRVLTIKYFISRWVVWLATDQISRMTSAVVYQNWSKNCCTYKLHMVSLGILTYTFCSSNTLGNTSPGSMHIPDLCYTTRPWLLLSSILAFTSLVPRPLPDFILQPWRKIKIWEWPGDEAKLSR